MKLVLAAATMGAAQAFVAPSAFSGASLSTSRVAAATSTPRMSLSEYKEELAATANAIAGPGEDPYTLHRMDRVMFLFTWALRVYFCVLVLTVRVSCVVRSTCPHVFRDNLDVRAYDLYESRKAFLFRVFRRRRLCRSREASPAASHVDH